MTEAIPEHLVVETSHGETFKFKLPSPRDIARINSRATALRRRDDPEGRGSEEGLDGFTWLLYRGMALLEMLPFQADVEDKWPWSEDPNNPGKLIVDSEKFPPGSEFKVTEVYRAFDSALATFYAGRDIRRRSDSSEAVAG